MIVYKYVNNNDEEMITVFGETEELRELINKCNYHSEVAPLFLNNLPKFSNKEEARYSVSFNSSNKYYVERCMDNCPTNDIIEFFLNNEVEELIGLIEFDSAEYLLNYCFGGCVITDELIVKDSYWATLIDFTEPEDALIAEDYRLNSLLAC